MKVTHCRTAALSIALSAAVLVPACDEVPGELPAPPPDAGENVRATPQSTVNGALAALEEGHYGRFPALVGLALTLKPPAGEASPGEAPVLEAADFESVRRILTAARETTPRLTSGGRVAAFPLPGHGLPQDELHLIRLRERWFFIVD